MKIVTQVGIIFSICWISQIIEKLLPFSFPASVIGMILLFILLCVHILKVDHIREKSDFLLENMAFFFIPAGVSIINYFDVLKNWVVQLIVICVVTADAISVVGWAHFSVSYPVRLTVSRKCRRTMN